jgi:hypothetical protein
MAILTLDAVLGVDGIFPFVIGPFDMKIGYRMEEIVAVGTKF